VPVAGGVVVPPVAVELPMVGVVKPSPLPEPGSRPPDDEPEPDEVVPLLVVVAVPVDALDPLDPVETTEPPPSEPLPVSITGCRG
jgi:hypothetical protein